MNENKYQYYLEDIGRIIKEKALETKEEVLINNDEYSKGRLFSFYDIISLMRQQAEVFDIDLKSINLSDINPDTDLMV